MSEESNIKKSRVEELTVRYEPAFRDSYHLIARAHEGISVDAFFDILEISSFTRDELADLLDVSFKTISRYKKENKQLNTLNSEQLLKIMRLFRHGEKVFGSLDDFNRWLRKTSHGLDNMKPIDLLRSSGGIDLIDEELTSIEHGTLA
jgi:putative toxin-antitoxin system antitoxin component (TIGR02293 family)